MARAKRTFPIIEKLGGRDFVADLLRRCGMKISRDAVRMWSTDERGVIPGDAARIMMIDADRRGIRYRGADFYPVANDNEIERAALRGDG